MRARILSTVPWYGLQQAGTLHVHVGHRLLVTYTHFIAPVFKKYIIKLTSQSFITISAEIFEEIAKTVACFFSLCFYVLQKAIQQHFESNFSVMKKIGTGIHNFYRKNPLKPIDYQ